MATAKRRGWDHPELERWLGGAADAVADHWSGGEAPDVISFALVRSQEYANRDRVVLTNDNKKNN